MLASSVVEWLYTISIKEDHCGLKDCPDVVELIPFSLSRPPRLYRRSERLFVIALGIAKKTIGAALLGADWRDPGFDSRQRALRDRRVIEISTPRRTAFDAKLHDTKMPAEFPMTSQERTHTLRTCYTPQHAPTRSRRFLGYRLIRDRFRAAGLSQKAEKTMNRMSPLAVTAICTLTAVLPTVATADPVAISASREDAWEFGAFIYGWYPNIGGKATFQNGQSADITVDASDLINKLKMAALLSFEARKGVWGMYTDALYLDVGNYRQGVHNFTIGGIGIPADVSASANFDMKATVWTLAGTYRLLASQEASFDVLAGARLLDLKESLDWTLIGNIGPIVGPGRAGRLEDKEHVIDGVIGFKGRAALGPDKTWFIPYYADIGTGNSDLTWQAMAGLGYAFKWGEIMGGYRYMDYQFKSSSKVDSLSFDGPILGVAFRW